VVPKSAKAASTTKKGATKTPPAKKPPGAVKAATVDPVARIAEIDRELLKTIQERARLVRKITKKNGAAPSVMSECGLDDEALARIVGRSRGPLPRRDVRTVFREMFSGCRCLVRERRIAFLGPMYSYSHLAAMRRFGQSVQMVPVGSISAVFEEVNRRHSDYGLVPIENSTDGRIADTLDMFTRLPVKICGEVEMEIHHALLGKCARTEIREVYSRPQALSQCRNWLAKHLPNARSIEVTSTSTAAQLAKEKPGAAAVASIEAGVHYGLDVVAEKIEDNPSNTTRFALIGDRAPQRSGNDRTAMLFQIEHRPGALAEAMNVFKRNQVNLTWIESFPDPGEKRAYLFFVEMEGHETDTPLEHVMATLGEKALRLEILGSFPASETEE